MKSKLFVILIFIPVCFWGQSIQDFGTWWRVSGEKEIVDNLSFSPTFSVRTHQNSAAVRQVYGNLAISYKLSKYFSVSSAYRMKSMFDSQNTVTQNRFSFDLTGKKKLGDFKIQLRSRTQHTFVKNDFNLFYNRFRFKVILKLQKGLQAFVQDEWFFHLNALGGALYTKNRVGGGLKYKLNKCSSIQLKYLKIVDKNTDYPNHFNAIELKVDFKL